MSALLEYKAAKLKADRLLAYDKSIPYTLGRMSRSIQDLSVTPMDGEVKIEIGVKGLRELIVLPSDVEEYLTTQARVERT